MIKYLWSAAGYGLIAVPLLYTRTKRSLGIQTHDKKENARAKDAAVANRTESQYKLFHSTIQSNIFKAYISNRRLLLSLADAGGRVMYAYKDLLELAGLTTRLYTFLATLHNVSALPDHGKKQKQKQGDVVLEHVDVRVPETRAVTDGTENGHGPGNVLEDEAHRKAPPLPLVRDLSLVLKEGDHLMITGSNGVGKTAVARVLAGLWAVQGTDADVQRPEDEDGKGKRKRKGMFVVPQRSYMVSGSLLDQIIYPDSYADYVESGRTEEELRAILESVWLGYLPEREGGWNARKEWRDVLSGGEKQRVSWCCLLLAELFC